MGILDTSVVIELPNLTAADLPASPTISVITLAELSVGPEVSINAQERAMRQLVLQQTEATFDPLPFDAACARRFAIVAGCLRQSGRKTQARAFDALIAATALAHDLPLYTRNAQDFDGITGLDLRPV
ncbi:MAG: type II toxin-antitoxin system VapC family toxin [Candidatus Nanopelagicales bacterium]|nr:type II toxin-antitoxin system VapC family toxin [Candidatus Nanopelagicales bacterium]